MKKFYSIFGFVLIFIMGMSMTSCIGCTRVDADEETVLIDKPWFFGHGGVQDEPVSTGLEWIWWSTDTETFKVVPFKHQVDMDDLFSDDNTPLDFHTIIITQIVKGKSPILLKNYGTDWFNTNLYNYYCNLVRDHISQHSPFDLMSNRAILNEIDAKVLKQMQDYVAQLSKEKEFPVQIRQVTIGKAIPNKEQLAEMNKTAKAERQRAKADKAYREELGLSTQDFISLKWIETIAAKPGASIDVMVTEGRNTTPMWNIKR